MATCAWPAPPRAVPPLGVPTPPSSARWSAACPSSSAGWSTISAPTTIIADRHDRVVPERAVQRLSRQIPGARLQLSASAGHLVPQRDPQAVVEAILAALGE